MFVRAPIEERIALIARRLSFDESTKHSVKTKAVELANKYLDQLSEDEERSTLDVALSAVYISCLKSGVKISQTEIASSVINGLNRWPCVVADMNKRLEAREVR